MEASPNPNSSAETDDRMRRLQAREARLNQELAELARERRSLHEIASRQIHEVEEATTELRQQHQALQTEREQFQQQKQQARCEWQDRWQTEWSRIQQKEAEMARDRLALEKQRREANGDIELQRRQLQAGWSDLRREQQAWQERLNAERGVYERQQQQLAERTHAILLGEQALQQQRELQEVTLFGQRQELGHLEMRIVHWRQKLEALQGEAALLEAALCVTPPSTLDQKKGDAKSLPAAELIPANPDQHEQRQLIELLVQISTELVDQVRCVEEHQQRLLDLRDACRKVWDEGLEYLARREDELRQREEQIRPQEDAARQAGKDLQRRLVTVATLQQELRCREARLEHGRRTLAARHGRLADAWRARQLALHRRQRLVIDLRQQWGPLRTQEVNKLLQSRTACERARHEYLTARESFRRRQQDLDDRERLLLQRELVMTQIEQQILAQDPNPAAAQRVLDRLRMSWEKAVTRQLKATRQRETELASRAEQLETLRAKLLDERQEVEALRRQLATASAEVQCDRLRLTSQRRRLDEELRRLRLDCQHLQCRIREQEQHLERLTLLLLDQRTEPPLALAA
jgi:hypothetical protein